MVTALFYQGAPDPEVRRVSLEIGEKTETFLLLLIPLPEQRLKNLLFGSIVLAKC